MAYVMSFHNKYFGLIFADTADGKSYTDKPAKAHRFATEQDVTPEARTNLRTAQARLQGLLRSPRQVRRGFLARDPRQVLVLPKTRQSSPA